MKLTKTEQQTIRAYDNNAKAWASSRDIISWKEELDKFQKLLPKGKILEIGSGGGRDAKELIRRGYDYVGTDISDGLLKEAKKTNPHAKFFKKSVYDLSFPEQFDGFWACAVLLHVPKKRINFALQTICRSIKKNGVGFISLKKGEGERIIEGDRVGIDYKRFFSFYSIGEFTKILNENGFEIIESYERENIKTQWLLFFVRKI